MSDPACSPETTEIIANMMKLATEQGLDCEVMEAYLGYRANGDTPAEAARCALWDWDIA